jgi:hypothetical protein
MKKLFISGTIALVTCAAITGCSSKDLYDSGTIEDIKKEQKITDTNQAYEDAFIKKFGSIAPGHTWGFEDSRSSTRGAVTDEATISGFELPNKIQQQESRQILAAFTEKAKNPANYLTIAQLKEKINLENYYLQQAVKNTKSQKNDKGKSNTGSEHKDYNQLYAYDYNNKEYVEVDNFEMGKTVGKQFIKGVTFMTDMGTPNDNTPMFAFTLKKDENGTNIKKADGSEQFTNYVIIEIEGEYYIGLDYLVVDEKKQYAPKGAYTGWIIKIGEAKPKTTPNKVEYRIFCEDMGEIGDMDFNDVVFDVTYNGNDIDIEVLAAGGTLPISIDGVPVTIGRMTNTGENVAGSQKFTISGGASKYPNAINIPIVVTPGGDALEYELTAEPGKAPRKICTYVDVPWADEYISIEQAYDNFKSWVNNATPEIWFSNRVLRFTDYDLDNND